MHHSNNILGRGFLQKLLLLTALLWAAAAGATPAPAPPPSTSAFINVPDAADMVYDDARDVLYIGGRFNVQRYQVKTNTFLPAIFLGGKLAGIDLSADGKYLAVANRVSQDGKIWIYVVDLDTSDARKVFFRKNDNETGTHAVAWGADANVLVSSSTSDGGWAPLRRYNQDKRTVAHVGRIASNSWMQASMDRSAIAIPRSSDLSWKGLTFGKYVVERQHLKLGSGDGVSNFQAAVNANGKMFAAMTWNGAYIMDKSLLQTGVLVSGESGFPVAGAFHPKRNRVHFPWQGTTKVKIFDTGTWTAVGEYDLGGDAGTTFELWTNWWGSQPNQIKTSRDGSLLFMTVPGGVRYVSTAE